MNLPTVLTETVLSLKEAAERCPEVGGAKPAKRTLYFWCDAGLKVGDQRVKLESARRGGIRVTSLEALGRFFTAVSGGKDSPPIQSPAERRRSVSGAMERLKKRFAKA